MARPKKDEEAPEVVVTTSPKDPVKVTDNEHSYPKADEQASGELPALVGAEIIARQIQQTGFDIIRAIKDLKK
ncbi:MAG: hypothetical protein OXB93_02130 [Cytophagales bacterium]|nr:hypothetical protein [Cytophagales bacterium]